MMTNVLPNLMITIIFSLFCIHNHFVQYREPIMNLLSILKQNILVPLGIILIH
uniref:Uncharacterized protein n=1 Tax=Helianthus annuus TaxID=4232 RepID=A0A251SRD6_HELAN